MQVNQVANDMRGSVPGPEPDVSFFDDLEGHA
jgi:hypothetical protein